jgi:hypothetical protein
VDLHHPAKDRKLFGDHFAQAIAKVVSAYGTAADPELYGRGAQAAAERAPVHRGHPGGLWLSTVVTKESVPFKPAGTFPYVPVTG